MLYHSGVLAGVGLDGIGSNIGLGNLAMGYPHSFILGLANQGQEGGEYILIYVELFVLVISKFLELSAFVLLAYCPNFHKPMSFAIDNLVYLA